MRVVGDIYTSKLEGDPTPRIYVPFWKSGNVSDLLVRCGGDPVAMEATIRSAIQSLDSGVRAPKMRTMQEMVDRSVAPRWFKTEVAGSFGIAALLLAALGIYGVVAYGVALCHRELGERMALGARASALVLRCGLRPVIAGLFAGLVGARSRTRGSLSVLRRCADGPLDARRSCRYARLSRAGCVPVAGETLSPRIPVHGEIGTYVQLTQYRFRAIAICPKYETAP